MGIFGRRMQSEQITRRPAERLRMLAPDREEVPAVLDGLPPAIMIDVVGATAIENIQDVMQALGELG
jgi:hypothetical protein